MNGQIMEIETGKAVVVSPQMGMQLTPTLSIQPSSFGELLKYAEMLSRSDLVPKDFKGNAGNVMVAIQMGSEIGLKPLQALQNIAVINGRPCLWGDVIPAIIQASGELEYMDETDDGNVATCRIKRRGQPEVVRTFSVADAKTAGLANKSGPWTSYPARMRQMRARGFAARDSFADKLKGLQMAEEVRDYETTFTPVEKPKTTTPPIDLKPAPSIDDRRSKALQFFDGLGVSAERVCRAVAVLVPDEIDDSKLDELSRMAKSINDKTLSLEQAFPVEAREPGQDG